MFGQVAVLQSSAEIFRAGAFSTVAVCEATAGPGIISKAAPINRAIAAAAWATIMRVRVFFITGRTAANGNWFRPIGDVA